MGLIIGLGTPLVVAEVQRDTKGGGGSAATFLELNPSVRSAALGGRQAALGGQVEGMFSNPASLGFLPTSELLVSHQQSFAQSRYDGAAFGLPLKKSAFGVSLQYLDNGSFDRIGIDAAGDPIMDQGGFHVSTLLLNGAWATRLTPSLSLGATAKGWRQNLSDAAMTGWAADLGLAYARPSWGFGLTSRNVGPSIDGFDLPRELALGGAYHLRGAASTRSRLSILSELAWNASKPLTVRSGLEFDRDVFCLRAGYEGSSAKEAMDFALGGGLQLNGWRLDYAWLPGGDAGSEQRFSLTVRFGKTPEEKERAAAELDRAMTQRMDDRAAASFLAGTKNIEKKKWDAAVADFGQALQWNPNHPRAAERLAFAKQRRDNAEADRHYQEAVRLSSENQWLEAAIQLKQTLNTNPGHKEAHALMTTIQKKMTSSLPSTRAPAFTDEAFHTGVVKFLNGDYDGALTQWNQIKKSSPYMAHLNVYIEQAKRMKAEQALADLQGKAKTADNEVYALSQKAYTLYRFGETEAAIAAWRRVLALEPGNQDAREALRNAEQKRDLVGETTDGPQARKVKELNAGAIAAYDQGKLKDAWILWKRALAIDPQNLWIRNNLARVEGEMGADHVR